MTKENLGSGRERHLPNVEQLRAEEKVREMLPPIIRAYNKGKLTRFSQTVFAERLGVSRYTFSKVLHSDEMRKQRENMKPRDRSHPKTPEIILYLRNELERYNAGEINTLPFQGDVAIQFGASSDTISAILHSPELRELYENRRTPLRSVPDVVVYGTELLEQVERNERADVPSLRDLGEQFGMSPSRVWQHFKEHGLTDPFSGAREKVAKEAAEKVGFPQTQENAWFLGSLFSRGAIKDNGGKYRYSGFMLTSNIPEVRNTFKEAGKFITRVDGQERELGDRKNPSIIFYHSGFAQLLAPFSIESRVDLLNTKDYNWLRTPRFLPKFVSGIFDAGGNPHFGHKRRRIEFATTDVKMADFLLSTLKTFGIQQPRIDRQGRNNSDPKKVYLGTLPDLKLFADKVISVSPKKQEVLDLITAYEPTSQEIVRQFGGVYPRQVYP